MYTYIYIYRQFEYGGWWVSPPFSRFRDPSGVRGGGERTGSDDRWYVYWWFFIFSWVECFGYLLMGCSVISVSFLFVCWPFLCLLATSYFTCLVMRFRDTLLVIFLSKHHHQVEYLMGQRHIKIVKYAIWWPLMDSIRNFMPQQVINLNL
jgi:hypothetical protein